jgi:hypothetical protein
MKYYANLGLKLLMVCVVDEHCAEVFSDIIIHDQPRLPAAEMKLAEYGFTRVGEWEQFANSWLTECERTTT